MSVERLRRLAAALPTGRPLPEDVATWLLDGCERVLALEARTLDEALDLSVPLPRGGAWRHPLRIDATRRRNRLLRELALRFDGDVPARARACAALLDDPECTLPEVAELRALRSCRSAKAITRVLRGDTIADRFGT